MTQFDKTTNNYIANIKEECKDISNTEKWINILKSSKSDSLIEFGKEYFNVNIQPNYVTKTPENSEVQDNIYVIRVFGKKENYIKVGYSSNMKGTLIEDNKFMIVKLASSRIDGKKVRGYEIDKMLFRFA